jgi:hypothetical protein
MRRLGEAHAVEGRTVALLEARRLLCERESARPPDAVTGPTPTPAGGTMDVADHGTDAEGSAW